MFYCTHKYKYRIFYNDLLIIDMHTHAGGDEPLIKRWHYGRAFQSQAPRYWMGSFRQFRSIVSALRNPRLQASLYVLKALSIFGIDLLNTNFLLKHLNGAKYVERAVQLATDGVVTDGELDIQSSQMYVSNNYVMDLAKSHEKVIPCISINPLRDDALSELERLVEDGAGMIKLFPSIQMWHADGKDEQGQVMPYKEKLEKFYQALADTGIVVMFHTGIEEVVDPSEEYFRIHGGDIHKWEPLLRTGVTSIAAHFGYDFSYWPGMEDQQNQMAPIIAHMAEYPNLFTDASGALSHNYPYIASVALEGYQKRLERFVYGSDIPVGLMNPKKLARTMSRMEVDGKNEHLNFLFGLVTLLAEDPNVVQTQNVFDKHYLMTKAVLDYLGTPKHEQEEFFHRGGVLVNPD
jgi:predicted TIM-barrel fold metal-dependent hydrolase